MLDILGFADTIDLATPFRSAEVSLEAREKIKMAKHRNTSKASKMRLGLDYFRYFIKVAPIAGRCFPHIEGVRAALADLIADLVDKF